MNTTSRRHQILSFIRSRLAAGVPFPSIDEIGDACGLKSRSAIHKHIKALEDSGELEATLVPDSPTKPKQRKSTAAGSVSLFEISVQDVISLNDGDLRELVARLCMAGLAEASLPSTLVTWGGDQRAPDGGIDVRVQLPPAPVPEAWVLNRITGIQVKATRMGPSEIQKEMCPGGLLRSSIKDLIRAQGSYIIATSDSAADEEYNKRLSVMKAAVAAEPGYQEANLDYFDARRLTDWTNRHPGVVAWVRSRLSRPLQGWRPHGQWADTRGGKTQAFIPDPKHRFLDSREPEHKRSLVEGLIHVRTVLRTGGRSVRLTGLSGVGKTRFAQALFEAESAPAPLPAELAVYTDTAQSPNPPPLAVLNELITSGRQAILIIDNCASQLHNQLTALCKTSNRVSLLTIEYDIREDLPSETNVFQLDTGSSDLIEKLIGQQFPELSSINVATITQFADGNSRVAVALASTMDRDESLSGLTDRELFDRLFWLGKEPQNDLMIAAQACALVYSFDGEELDGELAQLATLADQSVLTLYRHVSELQRRGLAQQRGAWRAVLPHAIANTLAIRALDSIPHSLILRSLVQGQNRLLRSFSRRLGYLHDSSNAAAIVGKWLSADGLLGDLTQVDHLQIEVLVNVAPVDPGAALQVIEGIVRHFDKQSVSNLDETIRTRIIRLVRSIAYESKYFERCICVLQAFALAEPQSKKSEETVNVIASLFFLYLSGTHATTEQRTDWVRAALTSSNSRIEALGLKCLSNALECRHFSSHYGFEFGARKRDYGWSPKRRDAQAWYASYIELATEVGQGNSRIAHQARDILAQHFRCLWIVAGVTDALELSAAHLLNVGWEKGWLAIRQTLHFDGKGLPAPIKAKLLTLEEQVRPTTLEGHIKAVVLNGYSAGVDFTDGEDISSGIERADRLARELGELVAKDVAVFKAVAHLVVANGQGRQWIFGQGLAAGTHSLNDCWSTLVSAFELAPENQRNIQVLRGFQHGAFQREPATFERLLDASLDHPAIKKWVPALQLSAPSNDKGCARLISLMDDPAVPAWAFKYLGYGRATEALSDDALAKLIDRVSRMQDGLEVAVEVLSMHIHDNPNPVGTQTSRVAQTVLKSFPLRELNNSIDYDFGRLVSYFLKESDGEAGARELLIEVRKGLENYSMSKYMMTETLKALFKVQAKSALDILVGDEVDKGTAYMRRRELAGGHRSGALSNVPIETVIAWCMDGCAERWVHVASLLPAFSSGENESELHWSRNVLTLLQRAPAPVEVAEALIGLIEPMSWSGSRAEAIKQRLPLLDELANVLGPDHSGQVKLWKSRIASVIEREARLELDEHRAQDERFE